MKLTGILGSASLAVLAMAGSAHAADKYVVGVSNTLIGNGWREEMICSIKAEAEASGKVSKVIVANRNGGPSEQIADIRNLISAGANIIIINPSDREALNPVIKQAADKGIVVVAVDQAVSAPEAYVLTNDQVEYAKLGAKWLFDKLGGKGAVVEMRGIDGVPADADRHQGFTETAKDYPSINVTSVFTGWALDKTAQATKNLLGLRQADRRRLDVGHRFDGRRCVQDRREAIRAGGRRGQQRLHRPARRPEGEGPVWRRRQQPAGCRSRGLEPRARRPGEEGTPPPSQDHANSLGHRQGHE